MKTANTMSFGQLKRNITRNKKCRERPLGFSRHFCAFIIQYKTVLYKIRDLCYNKATTIMGAL